MEHPDQIVIGFGLFLMFEIHSTSVLNWKKRLPQRVGICVCVLYLAYKVQPGYPLIVAANRDEFYDRPTSPIHFWKDEPRILAGRDLKELGTWMGISTNGRFAALTNFRDPNEAQGDWTSRGNIVTDYLKSELSPYDFLVHTQKERNEYRGFNVIVGNDDKLLYYSNVQNEITELSPGIYGVSNGFLDTPWPKVEKGRKAMRECLSGSVSVNKECLFELLNDRVLPNESELPDTGVGMEWEKRLSTIFIETEQYGTRSSTVLSIDSTGKGDYTEWSYLNNSYREKNYSFSWKR